MDEVKFNHDEIAKKWQKKWDESKVFKVDESSDKPKHYVLEMFPYPSSSGLHMGHALNYTIGDIFARFKRMQGFNVLHPMGFDSFGLPVENAAIKAKENPKKFTEEAIVNYIKQMKGLGLSYDWDRMVQTHKSDYFKWDQWIFLQMYKKGLVYKKTSGVNWCSKCNTVLANEQVHKGMCWRHEDTKIELKQLNQWYLKITEYADELFEGIKKLDDWPDLIKKLQTNWINKSYGSELIFEIDSSKTILVDAVHCLVDEEGNVNDELKSYLDLLPNKKIIMTNAPFEKHETFFSKIDYEIFTLENKPNKKDPEYYKTFLKKYELNISEVLYFEHDKESVNSAKSVGIKTFHYENVVQNVKHFIESDSQWPIFTTRADTLYGVTFMVVAAQHPRLNELVTEEQKPEVESFLKKIYSTKEEDIGLLEKEGVFTGAYAIHPLTGEKVPVYAGNFVLADYGSGMVMAVPAHDQRDYEFAKKYNIPIKQVISSKAGSASIDKQAFTEYGVLINSEEFNNQTSEKAKETITQKLDSIKKGRKTVNFKLRDWLISRQRYWGTPIPVYYDENNKPQPVPDELLPIELPEDVTFQEGKGNPLETSKSHKITIKGKEYRLETDTMDTFVNSSWYYLRYADSNNHEEIFNKNKANYWCPVDTYIGGKEHACMHLIYIRFYTKFLRDLGLLNFDEPTKKLFNQGMLLGPDGEKMSKSKGNVVLPEVVSEKYGLDSARFFLVSQSSPDKDINWSDKGAEGSTRLINKIFFTVKDIKIGTTSPRIKSKLHSTIKIMTENIESLKYNVATIKLREFVDSLEDEISKEDLESFIKLVSPICPHSAEELWEMIGNKGFVSLESWPKFDEGLIDEKLDYLDECIDTLRKDVYDVMKIIKIENPKEIKIIVSPEWKYDFVKEFKKSVSISRNPKDVISKMMSSDLKKYGQQVMKLIPTLLKDESKLPKVNVSLDDEFDNISENIKNLEREFNCNVIVEKADMSDENKAGNAFPGKPSIVLN